MSHYVECGGNYDESAAALHVHRSTLRYRLGCITALTGLDLRGCRYSLQPACRYPGRGASSARVCDRGAVESQCLA
ncbi:helix-turn-helix domain-containing protein [Mycobacterium simiae]|uniref:helix-turn-helix domain-containing protein n=1 Tax=Mycobacterium simiae TaxID=1784 RepID=UPI001E5B662F|nr:helix-turn-helix domain-containing protein [Mycobacterium simiae]